MERSFKEKRQENMEVSTNSQTQGKRTYRCVIYSGIIVQIIQTQKIGMAQTAKCIFKWAYHVYQHSI